MYIGERVIEVTNRLVEEGKEEKRRKERKEEEKKFKNKNKKIGELKSRKKRRKKKLKKKKKRERGPVWQMPTRTAGGSWTICKGMTGERVNGSVVVVVDVLFFFVGNAP